MDFLKSFTAWHEAHAAAQGHANASGRELGLSVAREYGRTVYRIHHLPRAELRSGWELRCEIVAPMHAKAKG